MSHAPRPWRGPTVSFFVVISHSRTRAAFRVDVDVTSERSLAR
jgi:hypothetical protein